MREHDESGTSAVEYALMITLVAAIIVGAVTALGGDTQDLYDTVCRGASPFAC